MPALKSRTETKRRIARKRTTPAWRTRERILLWKGEVVWRYKHAARAEEAVLSLFEAHGWPRLVPVPCELLASRLAKERLHNTIGNLNRRVRPYLHFWQEGKGTRIGWERARTASPSLSPSHKGRGVGGAGVSLMSWERARHQSSPLPLPEGERGWA